LVEIDTALLDGMLHELSIKSPTKKTQAKAAYSLIER
jgi:hypothetical protein